VGRINNSAERRPVSKHDLSRAASADDPGAQPVSPHQKTKKEILPLCRRLLLKSAARRQQHRSKGCHPRQPLHPRKRTGIIAEPLLSIVQRRCHERRGNRGLPYSQNGKPPQPAQFRLTSLLKSLQNRSRNYPLFDNRIADLGAACARKRVRRGTPAGQMPKAKCQVLTAND
jgi:hypothetical protein